MALDAMRLVPNWPHGIAAAMDLAVNHRGSREFWLRSWLGKWQASFVQIGESDYGEAEKMTVEDDEIGRAITAAFVLAMSDEAH